MATKAVLLAQRNKDGADLLLPNTSADLVGYKHEETKADNVKGALDELMAAKPGIVQRVEALENKIDGIGGGIPFDGGSLVTIVATSLHPNFPHIIKPQSSGADAIATLSDSSMTKKWEGKEFCHFDGQDIVFDVPGFYKISVEWGCAPLEGHTNYDMSYNIGKKEPNEDDYTIIVTQSGEVDTDADTWNYTTYDRIIKAQAGTRVRVWMFMPTSSTDSNRVQVVKFSVQVFQYPVTNEYQISNAEYFGIYQTTYTNVSLVENPNDPNQKMFDVSWTTASTVNETPDKLTVKNDIELVPYKSGMVLLNFSCTISTGNGTGIYDFIYHVYRRAVDGTDTLVRTGTFRVYEGQLNSDIYNLFILLPMQEGESVYFRCFTPTVFTELGYLCNLSGTVLPSITNTVELKPFEGATATSDGKQGLVPAPLKTSDDYVLNRFLSAKGGWGGFDVCALHPTAQSAELNKVLLDMGGVAIEGLNIDTLTRAGIFSASTFTGTLPEGATQGGILLNVMNKAEDGKYYPHQIFICYAPNRLFFRANRGGFAPGETPLWDSWAHLTPIPQAAAGVGQWQRLHINPGTSMPLPDGGVWAYAANGFGSSGGLSGSTVGVAAGGATITLSTPNNAIGMQGFCWRIA